MIRFFAGIKQIYNKTTESDLCAALAVMTDFVPLEDRDAGHIIRLFGIGESSREKGVNPDKFKAAVESALRAIHQGRGCEFTRTPSDLDDPGLNIEQLAEVLENLKAVCEKAKSLRERVYLIFYSGGL